LGAYHLHYELGNPIRKHSKAVEAKLNIPKILRFRVGSFIVFTVTGKEKNRREIMELLGEIILELYGELMFLIVPEKNADKKKTILTKVLAATFFLISVALAFWGIVLLADNHNLIGILPLSLAILFSLVQIIAGIILYNKNH